MSISHFILIFDQKLKIDQNGQNGHFWLKLINFSYLSADYNEKYRQRLSIPKYIINSSGDDFFTPDSSQFYFKKLITVVDS